MSPSWIRALLIGLFAVTVSAVAVTAAGRGAQPPWEADNPIRPLASPPLGMAFYLKQSRDVVHPARVRLGRWLFYDARLSTDGSISCATCHRPEHGFSEPAAVSTGVRGRKGVRKTPSLLNQSVSLAWHTAGRAFFAWDGRAGSLEEQIGFALANPLEMANAPRAMTQRLAAVRGYRSYFKEAFGTEDVTDARVAQAWCLERTAIARVFRDEKAALVAVTLGPRVPADAQVVEAAAGKVLAEVTRSAAGLLEEQLIPEPRRG
jgi:cytochrome c peroxidase